MTLNRRRNLQSPTSVVRSNDTPRNRLAHSPAARNLRVIPASSREPAAMRQEHGHGTTACTAGGDTRGCRTPAPQRCVNRRAKGGPVARSESSRPYDGQRPAPVHTPVTAPARVSILRWQVLAIIGDVIGNVDTPSETRTGLLRRLQENPDHPEQALLAHLKDRQKKAGQHH